MANTERCASPNQSRRLTMEHTDHLQTAQDISDSYTDDELSPETEAVSDSETAETKITNTPSSPRRAKQREKIDSPRALPHRKLPIKGNSEAGQGDVGGRKAATPATLSPREKESNKRRHKVGDDSSDTRTITEPSRADVPDILGGGRRYLIVVIIVACAAFLMQHVQRESTSLKDDVQDIDIFVEQMEKLKTQFPNQRVELWRRSQIHLQKHLQTAQPTEPVSLILTAGLTAQKTLHCLANGIASAFSAARNASTLQIDGATATSQDSDYVKLDIDNKLQGAFEGNTPVAVIHRFDELPPGSTLIFYRYCDHENAAYKKTFLIFTVLLGETELPAEIRLSAVEEMVDDHLQRKFLSHEDPVSFDRMDRDKYGGLWSRISHLILPVAAEERVERQGCGMT